MAEDFDSAQWNCVYKQWGGKGIHSQSNAFATFHYDRNESVMAIKPVADNSDPAAFQSRKREEWDLRDIVPVFSQPLRHSLQGCIKHFQTYLDESEDAPA